MRKVVIAIASILVVLVAVVIFLLVHDFDSPDLGKALLDKVGAATGVTITARTFHLNLLHGLKLEGVEVRSDSDGRSFQLALDTLVFEHRLAPLFSGKVAIERVLLDNPAIAIVESAQPAAGGDAAPAPAPAAAAPPSSAPAPAGAAPSGDEAGRKLSLELKELTIRNARLSIVHDKNGRIELEGLTVNLHDIRLDPTAHSLAGIAGAGDITLSKGTLNTLVVSEVRSAFELANAAFTMPELAATTEYGKVTSSLKLDLAPAPFAYELKTTGSAIDLNKLLGAPGGLGPGSLQLNATGQGPGADAVKADGSVSLAAGTIPAMKVTEGIDKVLGKNVLAGSPCKPAKAVFALARGVITLSGFQFETEHARVDLKGTAALAGALDLDLAVATPREGIAIEGVGANVLDVLSDASGWLPVPIKIAGTLDDPKVRPDTSALLAQAKTGTKREAKEAAQTAAQKAAQKAAAALKRKRQ